MTCLLKLQVISMAATKPLVKPGISDELLQHEIVVDTPSRLHFTLIDLQGGLGRIDGGVGVALSSPRIKIKVKPNLGEKTTQGEEIDSQIPPRVLPIMIHLQQKLDIREQFDIELVDSIPKHIGLGSNTQLALAVTKAVTYFMDLDLPTNQLAHLAGRGGTSGIGVATFEHGGFVMDAGHPQSLKGEFLPSHYSDAAPPKLMLRKSLPDDWYFVMTTPYIGQGLHGQSEAEIFKKHCPIPRREVEKLSHIILMKLLPATAEEDIISFGEALRQIQSLGFKKIENDIQDKIVTNLYEFYYDHDALGAGLSSFGPTTYALVEGEGAAKKLKGEIEKYMRDLGIACDVQYSNVDNDGAEVRIKSENSGL
jgi:beta-ribofuranosylaminobenzene 5'-phosphate synthase